jgi:hypothetical protein
MKRVSCQKREGFAWVELLLALAVLALLFQIFPQIGGLVLWILDVRNWPRSVWFFGNLGILFILIALRFGPQLIEDWRSRRNRLAAEVAEKHRQQELKDQRESMERLKQAQRRRIY